MSTDVKLSQPVPGRVLLHSCCAPCTGAVLECLLHNDIRPVVFFSNANIIPKDEYDLRREELARYCDALGVQWVDDEWDHEDWLLQVAGGRENEPERGVRCLECFRYRLLRAARYAASEGFSCLCTTLASSRWKSINQVDAAGIWAAGQVEGVTWWGQDWRKGGLQPRRSEIIREQGFYNQQWCGCEFSHKQK